MTTTHISLDEAKRDLNAVLSCLDEDTVVIIENGTRPVAMVQLPPKPQLTFEEKLALLDESGAIQDDTFAEDIDAVVEMHREPLDSSIWD